MLCHFPSTSRGCNALIGPLQLFFTLQIVIILRRTPQPIIRGFLHLCNDTVSFGQFTVVDAIVLPNDRFMHRTVRKKLKSGGHR
jgi:hypothetical protein